MKELTIYVFVILLIFTTAIIIIPHTNRIVTNWMDGDGMTGFRLIDEKNNTCVQFGLSWDSKVVWKKCK